MGEIKDFINLYIEDSGMIKEKLSEISLELVANIQENLYAPNHGWITGNLHDSIQSDIVSSDKNGGLIRAYTQTHYAEWVDTGHHSFPGYKYMSKGLKKTVDNYR